MGSEEAVSIIAALGGLLAVVVSVFTLVNSARKSAFDELRKVVDELKLQLNDAEEEIRRLQTENINLRKENTSLRRALSRLKLQVANGKKKANGTG